MRAVVMPKLGQSEEVGTIVQWRKKEGDTVAKGDIPFEIESFFDGTLLKILAREGQTVPVQTVVGYIGQPGEPIPETSRLPATKTSPPPPPKMAAPEIAPGGRHARPNRS